MNPAMIEPVKSPFALPRDFLENRYVYLTVSPRARGLSIGVNLNPDKHCNFDCVYCEVNRLVPGTDGPLDLDLLSSELQSTLDLVRTGRILEHPHFRGVPSNLLALRHVALSGDGEPTLCPQFLDVVHEVLRIRALTKPPFIKVVLITNASELHRPDVQQGISFFTRNDEVWAKLDAGTEAFMRKVNRTDVPLQTVLDNILLVGRKRPVVIQSLFAVVQGEDPSSAEIEAYAQRLIELRDAGARIALVQIYSATRPICSHDCEHLSLRRLSQIAQTVRSRTGLTVEIY